MNAPVKPGSRELERQVVPAKAKRKELAKRGQVVDVDPRKWHQKLYKRNPNRVPKLTRETQELSDMLLALDELGQQRAARTIRSIVYGIRNLGALPEEVVDSLWGVLCTVARKAIMKEDPDKLMNQLEDGLDPSIRDLIVEQSKNST